MYLNIQYCSGSSGQPVPHHRSKRYQCRITGTHPSLNQYVAWRRNFTGHRHSVADSIVVSDTQDISLTTLKAKEFQLGTAKHRLLLLQLPGTESPPVEQSNEERLRQLANRLDFTNEAMVLLL
jgi:hypothetical protein